MRIGAFSRLKMENLAHSRLIIGGIAPIKLLGHISAVARAPYKFTPMND